MATRKQRKPATEQQQAEAQQEAERIRLIVYGLRRFAKAIDPDADGNGTSNDTYH